MRRKRNKFKNFLKNKSMKMVFISLLALSLILSACQVQSIQDALDMHSDLLEKVEDIENLKDIAEDAEVIWEEIAETYNIEYDPEEYSDWEEFEGKGCWMPGVGFVPDEECDLTWLEECDPETMDGCVLPNGCDLKTGEGCELPNGCNPVTGENCPLLDECDLETGEGCEIHGCNFVTGEGCELPDGCNPVTGEGCEIPTLGEPWDEAHEMGMWIHENWESGEATWEDVEEMWTLIDEGWQELEGDESVEWQEGSFSGLDLWNEYNNGD